MKTTTQPEIASALSNLAAMIEEMPEPTPEEVAEWRAQEEAEERARQLTLRESTGFPDRYRTPWDRPTDSAWAGKLERIKARCDQGGIVALIGPRGTGKTRIASEVARDLIRDPARYSTAMEIFLKIRATYRKGATQSEQDVVTALTQTKLLVIDEIQERSESGWEDRLLTHIIDKRYGAMLPTIVIANLSKSELMKTLGESIASRLTETGSVVTIDGPSHRKPREAAA